MKKYIDNLRVIAAERQAQSDKNKHEDYTPDSRVVCDRPLKEQIVQLMNGLTPAERRRRWTMAEFVARLSGRFSCRPHPVHVGLALRALGWKPIRDWKHGDGRRFWVNFDQ